MPTIDTSTLRQNDINSDTEFVYNGPTENVGGVDYAVLELTRGYRTLVDIKNFSWLSQYNWHANVNPRQVRAARMPGRRMMYIQHEILKVTPWELAEKGLEIDHKDGFTLHNWEANLHIVDHYANMRNTDRHKNRVGVSFHQHSGLYIAYLSYPDSKRVSLGYWRTREKAIAVEAMARQLQPDYPNPEDFKAVWKEIRPRAPRDSSKM